MLCSKFPPHRLDGDKAYIVREAPTAVRDFPGPARSLECAQVEELPRRADWMGDIVSERPGKQESSSR